MLNFGFWFKLSNSNFNSLENHSILIRLLLSLTWQLFKLYVTSLRNFFIIKRSSWYLELFSRKFPTISCFESRSIDFKVSLRFVSNLTRSRKFMKREFKLFIRSSSLWPSSRAKISRRWLISFDSTNGVTLVILFFYVLLLNNNFILSIWVFFNMRTCGKLSAFSLVFYFQTEYTISK